MNRINEFIKKEQNLFIHFTISIIMIIFSFIFKLNIIEWGCVLIAITFVIVSELVNSSVERVTDIYITKYNINAKIAKDTAAGAVFISAILSIFIGVVIFLPKVLKLLEAL